MKPVFSTLAVAFAFLAGTSGFAAADEVCMPIYEMKASLVDWYGERPVSDASQDGTQIWASDRTGTWTLIRLLADGNSCVIETGEDWNGGLTGNELLASLRQ